MTAVPAVGRNETASASDRPFRENSSWRVVIARVGSAVPVTRAWVIALMAIGLSLIAFGSASAQTAQLEKFRADCRAQFAYLRGPGQAEIVADHVRACVQEKLHGQAQIAEAAPGSGDQPIPLSESPAWLVGPRKGPARAKGVIYFVAGYSPGRPMIDGFRLVPYFMKTMADDGWDVVRAKLPADVVGPMVGVAYVGRGAQTIRQRVVALRAEGYKQVIAAGHSWGAWAAMLSTADGGPADAVLLSAPNTFGPATVAASGRPNPNFHQIVDEFGPALTNDKAPTVMLLPNDNVWDPDPGTRGQIAEQYFTQAHIPHLVITKPPGFFGHYAGWLPVFDYAYGACLRAFLINPTGAIRCAPPPLVDTDFRSIVNLKQVAGAAAKRITATAPLVGRKFVAYTLQDMDNKHFDYVSTSERVTMLSDQQMREPIAFHDGQQCAGQVCSVLLRWSDHEVLEFDPVTGATKAWWTEDSSTM